MSKFYYVRGHKKIIEVRTNGYFGLFKRYWFNRAFGGANGDALKEEIIKHNSLRVVVHYLKRRQFQQIQEIIQKGGHQLKNADNDMLIVLQKEFEEVVVYLYPCR